MDSPGLRRGISDPGTGPRAASVPNGRGGAPHYPGWRQPTYEQYVGTGAEVVAVAAVAASVLQTVRTCGGERFDFFTARS
jgi:hypothetical protein